MKKKTYHIVFALILVLGLSLGAALPVAAATTWTVDDDGVEYPGADFTTIQAAINAADSGDIINVYPGTYDPQIEVTPPGWGGHYYAQGVVVWKDGLTIRAVDPDPSNTIIRSEFPGWMDKWRIQRLTGGVWTGSGSSQTGGFDPQTSASPSAMMIVASDVTVSGFTFHTTNTWNTAGVMIGGVAPGDSYNLGCDGNTVQNCVFSNVWHAVYIWHSSNNMILNNTVEPLGTGTNHWAAIEIYDGYIDAQINLGYTSKGNKIINNTLADKGIFVGAWAPSIWTDNSGTKVHGNQATSIGTGYSMGDKIFSGNKCDGYWAFEASDYKFPGKSNH